MLELHSPVMSLDGLREPGGVSAESPLPRLCLWHANPSAPGRLVTSPAAGHSLQPAEIENGEPEMDSPFPFLSAWSQHPGPRGGFSTILPAPTVERPGVGTFPEALVTRQ